MKTMELDAQRAMLAREILNTEDVELLKVMNNAYKRFKTRMVKAAATKAKTEPEPDSKEYIMNGLKEAFMQLNDIKAGKLKGRPAEELLKELQEEEKKYE